MGFYFHKEDPAPEKPWITSIKPDKEWMLVLCWWSDDDEKRHFYLIADPACRETEFISPAEWEVIFLGSIKQLRESWLASDMEKIPADTDEKALAVLKTKGSPIGFDGRNMGNEFFLCPVIRNFQPGKEIASPRLYIHER
jgi:hypothetical protein